MANLIESPREAGLALSELDRDAKSVDAHAGINIRSGVHGRNSTLVDFQASTGVVARHQQVLYGPRMSLGTRITQVLEDRKMKQADLAKAAGMDEATLSAIIVRNSRRSEFAPQIAEALGISLHWLMTGEGPRDLSSIAMSPAAPYYGDEDPAAIAAKYVMVRRVTPRAAAGEDSFVDHEEIQDYIAFRRDWLRKKGLTASNVVAAQVDGESMSPTLENGDIVLVAVTDREVRDGLIYAFRSHGAVRVKRFQLSSNGTITIVSDNKSPRYRDEVLQPEQFESLDILGRVVWRGGEQ